MKFFRGRVSLFAASVLVLALAAPAFPQALTGGINGTSTDASGALIPGVEVTVSSPAMIEGSRSAITNETGSYRFPLLPPGSYTVTFVLPGFATLNIEDVVVPVGTTMTINGTLEVATVAETITVVSETPLKLHGQYDLPYGVMFSSSFRSQSGDYYGREALMRNALNSTVVVPVEEQAGRLPRVNLWDNRFSKTFQINDRHSIEAMIDFFNTLNVSTVLRVETRNGPRFGLVRSAGTGATSASPIVPGRIFRLAARWRF